MEYIPVRKHVMRESAMNVTTLSIYLANAIPLLKILNVRMCWVGWPKKVNLELLLSIYLNVILSVIRCKSKFFFFFYLFNSCGKHQCSTRCCQFRNQRSLDGHSCNLICGKLLSCGLHTCQEICTFSILIYIVF